MNSPMNTVNWNSRTTQQGGRQVNAVHPAPEGYRQVGDSFYGWIKVVLSESGKAEGSNETKRE